MSHVDVEKVDQARGTLEKRAKASDEVSRSDHRSQQKPETGFEKAYPPLIDGNSDYVKQAIVVE